MGRREGGGSPIVLAEVQGAWNVHTCEKCLVILDMQEFTVKSNDKVVLGAVGSSFIRRSLMKAGNDPQPPQKDPSPESLPQYDRHQVVPFEACRDDMATLWGCHCRSEELSRCGSSVAPSP